jgi:hypothetical protein
MAAPVATYIQLPLDTGNTGKKVRTISRTVGSDTVHEHFYVNITPRSILGRYYASSGVITTRTSADNGTSTGNYWLINPAGSGIKVAILSTEAATAASSAAAAQTSTTRMCLALFTATGTPSGANVPYAKRDSTDATPLSSLRTAVTGLTVTVGNTIRQFLFPGITGTTGVGNLPVNVFPEREMDWEQQIILRAGEGVLNYQPDASTLATLKATVNHIIEEFE